MTRTRHVSEKSDQIPQGISRRFWVAVVIREQPAA